MCKTHADAELRLTEDDAVQYRVDQVPPVGQQLAAEGRCLEARRRRTDADDAALSSVEDHGSHRGTCPTTLISPTVSCWREHTHSEPYINAKDTGNILIHYEPQKSWQSLANLNQFLV